MIRRVSTKVPTTEMLCAAHIGKRQKHVYIHTGSSVSRSSTTQCNLENKYPMAERMILITQKGFKKYVALMAKQPRTTKHNKKETYTQYLMKANITRNIVLHVLCFVLY